VGRGLRGLGGIMKKLLLCGTAVLGALAVLEPVLADEAPRRERRAQQVRERPQQQQQQQRQTNWDGGQLGGSNGASGVNNNFAEPGAYICPSSLEFGVNCFETPFSFGGTKWVYTWGAFAGYRMQFGTFVGGVEADVNFKKGEHSATQLTSTCLNFVVFFCELFRNDLKQGSVRQTWDASLRARGGFLITPDTLLYVTGGVAFGEVKGSFHYLGTLVLCCDASDNTFPSGDSASASGRFSEIRTGWTAGAGVETEVWRGVKVRAEYRYTDFGDFSVNLPVISVCTGLVGCNTPSNNVRIDLENSFHAVRFGVGIDLN
jgi:outer membrane immunogenic protein